MRVQRGLARIFRLALPAVAAMLLSVNSQAAPITMGMAGDSLTDDYLGGPKANNNDLAAYSWGQILATLRPGELVFGSYKPMGDVWDNNIRYSGYENNWATSGGVASINTRLYAMGTSFPVSIFGASYLTSQITGLSQMVSTGKISTAYVGIGSNDFFYRTNNFSATGEYVPSNRPIDQAFIDDISGSILAGVDTLRNAGIQSSHPVDIVLGLLPPGTAGGSNPTILDGIEAVNQKLIAGAAARGIPVVDVFGWNKDLTRADVTGAVHIGQLVINIGTAASDLDIDVSGTGPCDSFGCALPSHASHFAAEDGLHPNTIIQALIANQVIEALNSHYGHSIPLITDAEILSLVGVPLPSACQDDSDNDGKSSGALSFVEGACPANTLAVPLVSNTVRLGAMTDTDNCPFTANSDQLDSNGNGIGDACEGDQDNDAIDDADDNCPTVPNSSQLDSDGDETGDACDEDFDNDTVPNIADNCPLDANTDQQDKDRDLIGDACDDDADNDNISNATDNCLVVYNPDQKDMDGDLAGDLCDDDLDGDTVLDTLDNCPVLANTNQSDIDADLLGDVCDPDMDGDGRTNALDNCPMDSNANQKDKDSDGIGDVCDPDLDGDLVPNETDNCPLAKNATQKDTDGDLIGDTCDPDDDNDTVPDGPDVGPLNPNVFCNVGYYWNGSICEAASAGHYVPTRNALGPTACATGTYQSATGQSSCIAHTNCVLGSTYETTAPTAVNDRVCSTVRVCGVGEYEVTPPTLTTDRVCFADDQDTDGVLDEDDNCPAHSNPDQADNDRDRFGDVCDTDDDNDTLPDLWEQANGRDPLKADYMVSVGSSHTCALDNTGVNCWGENTFGQISVPALTSPTMVSAGYRHSCAIDATGVKCWGAGTTNTGSGDSWGQSLPPALSNPTQVSAGYWHTCALDDNGVSCWGKNDKGQTTVPALTNPVQVAVGKYHSCALDDNGVQCWGFNGNDGRTNVPVLVNPLSISLSVDHSCAIDQNGMQCWGNNNAGQTSVPGLTLPQLAAVGATYSCALDNGSVQCWGDPSFNTVGQTTVPPLDNPATIDAGISHTCALTGSGVKCWGRKALVTVPVLDFTQP